MADSTSSSDSNRHTRLQKSVLTSKHQELRDKLNFHSIYPHLNSHGLLPSKLDQVELVDEQSTLQRKIDKVLAHMPECGNPNFLNEFIVCLKDSNDGTGDAHRELAETIERAYKSELERSASPEIVELSVTVESGPCHIFTEAVGKIISSTNLKRCVCCCAPIAVVIFIATLTIIIFLNVPHLSNTAYAPNITAVHNAVEIKLESDMAFWIAEASISVNNCDSNMIVVQGKSCSSLPTTDRNDRQHDVLLHLTPIYYLEKSIMNLLDIYKDVGPNASIWILNKMDYLASKNGEDNIVIKQECDSFHKCPHHAATGESCCYHAQDYAGGNISHEIIKSGFYFAIPQPFSHTFDVSYVAVAYDIDAIVQLPDAEVFPGSAKISDWFKFHSTKCILLNTTSCREASGFKNITVSNVSKRIDVVVLALILVFVVSVFSAGLVILCKLTLLKGRWCHAKRHNATFDEMEPSDATALIESTSRRMYNITIST